MAVDFLSNNNEVARRLREMTSEELEKIGEDAARRGHERLVKMLSQYDDEGHVLPEYADDPDQIQFRGYGFLSMTSDERAAYIVSEKKRLGLLV